MRRGGGVAVTSRRLLPGPHPPTVGASGAIFGVIVAYGVVFAERVIYLMVLFPIKARTFAWIMFAVAFLSMLTQSASGVSNIAHLGGMVVGWLYLKRAWRVGEMSPRAARWHQRRTFRVMDSPRRRSLDPLTLDRAGSRADHVASIERASDGVVGGVDVRVGGPLPSSRGTRSTACPRDVPDGQR